MTRCKVLAGGLVLILLALSCAPATEMTGVWSDPSFKSSPGSKVLVVGLANSEGRQRMFETAMAQKLQARKLVPVMSADVWPKGAPVDTATARQVIHDQSIDLLTVTRLIGVDKETEYVPGSTYYTPMSGYYGFYPYYSSTYAIVSDPGYLREYSVVSVETNVYDAKTEKLVWSGQSKSFDPGSATEVIDGVTSTVVYSMRQSGIIK